MPDPRFVEPLQPQTVAQLAAAAGAEVVRGGDVVITSVAPLARAGAGDLAFMGSRKFAAALAQTQAGAVVVPPAAVEDVPAGVAIIVSRKPQAAWAIASGLLHRLKTLQDAISPAEAAEDDTVVIEPGVVLGQGVRIGSGSRIGANTVIGPGVQIGRNCQVGSCVSLSFCLIGDGVKILSGARLGEAGFGATVSDSGILDIPQLGRVIVQDNVTVGANTCIDRGAWDDTVIGEGTKIDNLVMIGHNCTIGRNNLLAGHTGLSGSVTTGDNVVFGGQAGVGDHITIGTGASVAAGGGVLKDIPPGEIWSGYPAKPLRDSLREAVWLSKQVRERASKRAGKAEAGKAGE